MRLVLDYYLTESSPGWVALFFRCVVLDYVRELTELGGGILL